MPDTRTTATEAEIPIRRFTVGDAMILLAVGALGLAMTRFTLTAFVANLRAIPVGRLVRGEGWESITYREGLLYFGRRNVVDIHSAAFWFLISWEYVFLALIPGYLAIRLRKPRAPLRRLIQEPGLAAVTALVVGIVVALAAALAGIPERLGQIIIVASIPAAWIALAVTRRWRWGEPRWIGRLGLALGLFWSVALPLHLLLVSAGAR